MTDEQFREEISKFVVLANLTGQKTNDLLDILRRAGHILPKDYRTLKATPQNIETFNKCGGLANALKYHLSDIQDLPDVLNLHINIDGLSLSKSTTEELWPILCRLAWSKPFEIALFHGMSKPVPVEDFLEDFILEYQNLKVNGLYLNNRVHEVKIEFFVCDAVARQHIKKVKSHSGYYACERCQAKGCQMDGYMVFDTEVGAVRTDEEFEQMKYLGSDEDNRRRHQIGQSPLIGNFNCVSGFVLDYMHLVLLGVVKRLIEFWKKGSPNDIRCKLSENLRDQIDKALHSFRNFLPFEFSRQPRSIKTSDRWKATECRQFLLYTGPIILRGILDQNRYQHFMALSVAMRILLTEDDDTRNHYLPFARQLLQYFVQSCPELYEHKFVSYNIHCLLHLVDDCELYGISLNKMSAFPFESHLHYLKRKILGSKNKLVQLCKHLVEENQPRGKAILHTRKISIRKPNNCFSISDTSIAVLVDDNQDGTYNAYVVHHHSLENYFGDSLDATMFGAGRISCHAFRRIAKTTVRKGRLCKKFVRLKYENFYYFVPLLH